MENLSNMMKYMIDNKLINYEDILSSQLSKSIFQKEYNSNYERRSKDEYIRMHNYNIIKRNSEIKQLGPINNLQIDSLLDLEKYNPFGKNIEKDFQELKIKDLKINTIHHKKYLVLKIISKLLVVKSINFLGEDSNKDIIHISLYGSEKYFNVNSWEQLENDIYTEGKYVIIIEPYYKIYMTGSDGLRIEYPNEIIIFNNEEEINDFLDKIRKNKPTSENFKLLGNLMLKNNFSEKAIFYYKEAIKLNNQNNDMDIILHSNLSEAFYKYGYFTKCIQNADYCLNKINKLLKNKKNNSKENETFLSQQYLKALYRKIKGLISLRKFKEAYELLFNNSENENKSKKDMIQKFINLEEIKNKVNIIKNGYENNIGRYDFQKMLEDEKIDFELKNYGDYLNQKIEFNFEKGKGIKLIANEKINLGELILVEKSLSFTREKGKKIIDRIKKESNEEPSIIDEIELFNKLSDKMLRAPLDNEKFYYLYDGKNLGKNIFQRKEYLNDQESGKIKLTKEKVNRVIFHNKYGTGRYFLYNNEICSGVWGYASLINHDCLPNTTYFGIGDFYILFCIKEIEKGEEITTSYYDSSAEYKERQEILLNCWGFKCTCQLCNYQKKRNISDYNGFIKLFKDVKNNISLENAQKFEQLLEKNKKKYSCYELANGYLKLEEYYCILNDYNKTKNISNLITKYADGKNFIFQLKNLYNLFLGLTQSEKNYENELFTVSQNIYIFLKKYTPFTFDEIKNFMNNNMEKKNADLKENISKKNTLITCENYFSSFKEN